MQGTYPGIIARQEGRKYTTELKNIREILLNCGCKYGKDIKTTENEELLASINTFPKWIWYHNG